MRARVGVYACVCECMCLCVCARACARTRVCVLMYTYSLSCYVLFVNTTICIPIVLQMTSYVINCKAVKSQDFSNLHFVGKLGQKIKYLKSVNFGTTQAISIKLVSLKSDLKKKSIQIYKV